ELAANNQRPGGREVLRDDGQGNERSYYLYEISATVYPKRPGKIDAEDVQIVVNYPTELGKARDPFAGFFENQGFGGGSPLSQMLDDDFFTSPFGNRLTVSATRPIVGEATVDSTEVLPVPSEGRPVDYRGAVGRYNIVTQATPTDVNAGDPITLNIGISGTGPMELVQAPPLSELPTLTADFKVADQSLAGFVQDDTKLFSTTVRPRRAGITEIPPIPFSFFDPATEKYETVMSQPISITVKESESLSLDAIVGKRQHDHGGAKGAAVTEQVTQPDFTNDNSPAALVPRSATNSREWWWFFVYAPPMMWLVTVLVRHRDIVIRRLPDFQSPSSRCLQAITNAREAADVVLALSAYIERRTRQACANSAAAIGALRTAGLSRDAIDVEAFFQQCESSPFTGDPQQSLTMLKLRARELVTQIASAIDLISKSRVRRSKRTEARHHAIIQNTTRSARRTSILLFAVAMAAAGNVAAAEQPASDAAVRLSASQQQTLLTEAGELYSKARNIAKTDSAEATDLFTAAAQKYQLLADSGIHNALLYRNLGNAYLQSNQLGRAIANYERASQLAPHDPQLAKNLEFAVSLVRDDDGSSDHTTSSAVGNPASRNSIIQTLRDYNTIIVRSIGLRTTVGVLILSSLLFWGVHIARVFGYRFAVWRYSIMPLILLMISLSSAILTSAQPRSENRGIIVTDNLLLRTGDGDQFDAVVALDSAQGRRVQILVQRGNWLQVRTRHGHVGWLPSRDVESL
ncbi:MAG: BatD family protein, partial [Planctomycetaceae bacterium]|nr:BatD family protein [Planctomycetaceae bacterium]